VTERLLTPPKDGGDRPLNLLAVWHGKYEAWIGPPAG